jgi:hypothetical protein
MSEGAPSFDAETARHAFRDMRLAELLEGVDAEQLEAAIAALGQWIGEATCSTPRRR